MKIFSFAYRNVGRNKSRTIVTIGAMAFAGALMIFYTSLMEGLLDMMVRNVVSFRVGEVQMHHKDYRDDPDLYKRIENPDAIIEKLAGDGLFGAGRLYGFGLGASGQNSGGVSLIGLDIEREAKVTRMNEKLMEGRWLDNSDPKGVVIGRKLARTLDVSIGAEVVVLSQAADGSMANDLYRVRGILQSIGGTIDSGGLIMLDTEFRELMALPHGVHEIAVSRAEIKESVIGVKEKTKAIAPDLETLTWKELSPVIAKALDTMDASLFIMTLITYAAIVMVTLNAMLMSVFERIREFGVMKALGVTPWQIVKLISTEALIQGLIACSIAAIVGIPISIYVESHGLDLAAMAGVSAATVAGVAIDTVWESNLTLFSVAMPLITLMIITMIAVIYPSLKAALIQPVKAIHHI